MRINSLPPGTLAALDVGASVGGQRRGTTSLAWTIAADARRPETTGQTYQRYAPGSKVWRLPPRIQLAGSDTSGRVVLAEKTSDEPRKIATS